MTLYEHSVAQRLRTAELERAAAEARTVEEARTRQVAEAKVVEERKRRHATLGLATAILILLIAAGTATAWWIVERRATQHDVETALEETAKDRESERCWPEAQAALERAEGRLGTWGLPELRAQRPAGKGSIPNWWPTWTKSACWNRKRSRSVRILNGPGPTKDTETPSINTAWIQPSRSLPKQPPPS